MKRLIAALLLSLLTIPVFGQNPPAPPSPSDMAQHQVKRLTVLLSLTSTQQQQANTIYTNAAKSEQTIHQGEKSVHDSLRAAIRNNDTAAIDQLTSTLAQSMAQSTSIHAKADAAFYQILTAEQQARMSDLESEHLEGFGGPGGPPAMGFR